LSPPTEAEEGGAGNGASQPSPESIHEAELEAANGLRQYDTGLELIGYYQEPGRPFSLQRSHILELQSVALDGLDPNAGNWRTGNVQISKSRHQPPGPHLVPMLTQELCDYINDKWHEKSAFHLASYVMWKLNWIHPFPDGNGRTSRILSYLILNLKLGYLLPGKPTIPEQIQADRTAYFKALEAADEAAATGGLDVSAMETLLKGLLATQLLSVIDSADGTK
jgi:Fic family protein